MIKKVLKLILLVSMLSCTRVSTLNLKPHKYNELPAKIVWLQVPGLKTEHLAMLHFEKSKGLKRVSLENVQCLGNAWSYNLFEIRPPFASGLMSQMVGSKNVNGSCSDFSKKPVWNQLFLNNYFIGSIESGVKDSDSLTGAWACEKEGKDFKKNLVLWKMAPTSNKKASKFHYQDVKEVKGGNIYYDLTCRQGGCYSSLSDNIKSIWNKIYKDKGNSFFLIREFSYIEALKRKDIISAKEILHEIDKIHLFFKNEFQKEQSNYLLLVSSASPLQFEFPAKGKEWKEFQSKGKFITFRKKSLLSPIFADGSRSENFCGVYDEFEIYKRVLWGPKQNNFNFKTFNF